MDRKTVDKITHLARLELSEDERDRLAAELGRIIEYADRLNELDTDDVQPFMHAAAISNVFRDDAETESLAPDDATANAPGRAGHFFRVPRVVEG